RNRDEKAQGKAHEPDEERGGQGVTDHREHRAAVHDGPAEVELDGVDDVVEVLLPDGDVETEVLAQGGDRGLGGVLPGDVRGGVAGKEPQHQEDQRHDTKDGGNDLKTLASYVRAHA